MDEDCFIIEFDPSVENGECGGRNDVDDDGGDKVRGSASVVSVNRKEDVRRVEMDEDCFILEFDPSVESGECGGRNVVDDDGGDKVRGSGSVVSVKRKEDVRRVEMDEDCFILEFDPTKNDSGGSGRVDGDDDDEEEENCKSKVRIIGRVVSVKRKEDVKKVEMVEDCFILEFDPNEDCDESIDFSKLSLCEKPEATHDDDDDDDDVCIVSEKGQVACRDYPHARHLCATHPFKKTNHETHCRMCYCYVCDLPAPCKKWKEECTGSILNHCDAEDTSFWRTLRRILH